MDTLLGHDVNTSAPVYLPEKSRDQMLYLIGKTGMGKSTLLLRLILDNITHGRGVCVFDPHGDLVDQVIAKMDRNRIEDLWLGDVTDQDYTIGVNLFHCSNRNDPNEVTAAADAVVSAFKKVWGVGEDASWGPALEDLLRMIAYTLIHNPGHYMTHIPELLYDEPDRPGYKAPPNAFRQRLVANVPIKAVRDYWQYDYDPLSDRDQRFARSSTMNKVRAFLSSPFLEAIVGGETTLDFDTVMNENAILLMKLPWRTIGEEAVALLGSTLINQFLLASGRRSTRAPFFLYADEYQRFATPAFQGLIDEARKFGIATTIAHQRRDQLDYQQRNVPLGAANLIVFGVTGEDAEVLAGNFTIPEVPGEKQPRVKTQPVYRTVETTWQSEEHHQRYCELLIEYMQVRWESQLWERLFNRVLTDEKLYRGDGLQRVTEQLYRWKATPATYIFDERDTGEIAEEIVQQVRHTVIDRILVNLKKEDEETKSGETFLMWKPQYPHDRLEKIKVRMNEERRQGMGTEQVYDYDAPIQRVIRKGYEGRVGPFGVFGSISPDFANVYEWEKGPPRPVNDVRAELANDLATAPPYQARIRIRVGNGFLEYTIRTVE